MPTLATLIGLNESIVLQQVHYWLKHKEKAGQDFIDGHYWVYNTYEQWQKQFPFFSPRTVRRTFTSLEKSGLLISGNYNKAGFDKTKWYTIDYIVLNNLIAPSGQNGHIVRPNWTDGSGQIGQTNTRDYTETTPETTAAELKGATLKQRSTIPLHPSSPFDSSILKKQIIKSCHKHGIQDCSAYIEIIECYYTAYMATFHQEHPRLSATAMDNVIEALSCGSDMVDETDPETYKALIEQHFKTRYDNCDYNICHFMTEGVRNNRFYETCY